MILLIGGIAVGQEFRPDKDYTPNDYEKALIDRIKSAAKPDTSGMEFIVRMPFAIETACKALTNPTAKAIDSIMEYAGGGHKVIFCETMAKLQADSAVIAEVMAVMPKQGHFAVKTVELPKGTFLVVYWSDIAYRQLPFGGGSGAGQSPFPGDLDYFHISLSDYVAADSLMYILYRGVSSLAIHPDSIVECRTAATIHDTSLISIEFRKKSFDIWTVNLYGLNRATKRYDIATIVIPPIVVDRPQHPRIM
ncbi:MAG: hypothetical protein PHR28_09650 [candidate division Zixibacteria bacterium]|nr:hypothetical protein [candidate division Zixibacteria bacterium]